MTPAAPSPAAYQAVLPAPFGALGLTVTHGRLTAIEFLPYPAAEQPSGDPYTRDCCARLQAYLASPTAPLDFAWPATGTPFQQRVWRAIQRIPTGATLSYGELAAQLGSGPRAVANACGANPLPLIIPCHRVIASNGLGGFMAGRRADCLDIKRWLLAHERHHASTAG